MIFFTIRRHYYLSYGATDIIVLSSYNRLVLNKVHSEFP